MLLLFPSKYLYILPALLLLILVARVWWKTRL